MGLRTKGFALGDRVIAPYAGLKHPGTIVGRKGWRQYAVKFDIGTYAVRSQGEISPLELE